MKCIFRQKMAGFLMMQGFELKAIYPNLKDNTKKVFMFEDSQALKDTMTRYPSYMKELDKFKH